ncbi:HEAT repeat domain-containing protein [Streptomyces sp. NPDC055060]
MTTRSLDLADRLVRAVTAGDADTARICLEQGAAPDSPGPDGLPLLCIAVARMDPLTAEVLVDGGADQDRVLADGSTPLLRAVDAGSPALVDVVLGNAPRLRLSASFRQRLLDLARHWHETGVADELRRRTGALGSVVVHRIDEGHRGDTLDEISLGGHTVRDGHGAILTHLEWEFGVLAPFADVMARAVPHARVDDSNWFAAAYYLGARRGPLVWSALTALRRHPDPLHRRFLAQVMGHRCFHADIGLAPAAVHDVDFLASWARDESDGQVLAAVLDVFSGRNHPDQEAIGLRYTHHRDPRVRSEAVFCVSQERTARSEAAISALLGLVHDPEPEVRASVAQVFAPRFTPDKHLAPAFRDALLVLVRDDSLWVRRHAAQSLACSDDRTGPTLDAFLALLDETDTDLRLEAAWALARRGDPRAAEAYERVGPLDAFSEHDHRLSAAW